MNKEFIKRLTLAHGWLGLIFSGFLFIIFFAGSIALFRQEITLWSMQPHMPVTSGPLISIDKAFQNAVANRDYDAKEHITVVLPTKESHFIKAYVDIKDRPQEPHYDELTIDPTTGEIVSEGIKFELAEFIYHLHYDLNIPQGKYVLGFVTLFFLFALISGIFIHAKKLISNFFQYRGNKHKRSQLLDMHNVVGVVSLPFTVMYAISGLIFNLVIIYQIAFAVTVYKGDGEALLKDAGFETIAPVWKDKPIEHISIDNLVAKVTEEYQLAPRVLRIFNYGDESALIQLRSQDNDELTTSYSNTYSLYNGELVVRSDSHKPNSLVVGTGVLRKLHYGNYASLDLRLIYLLLGLAVCALIMTGNLLWIEKREKQRNFSMRTISIAKYVTLVSSAGIMFATASAFVIERLLPIAWNDRAILMGQGFWSVLALCAVIYLLPFARANYKRALAFTLYGCGIMYSLTVIIGLITLNKPMIALIKQQQFTSLAIDISLVLFAGLYFLIGKKLYNSCHDTEVLEQEEPELAIES